MTVDDIPEAHAAATKRMLAVARARVVDDATTTAVGALAALSGKPVVLSEFEDAVYEDGDEKRRDAPNIGKQFAAMMEAGAREREGNSDGARAREAGGRDRRDHEGTARWLARSKPKAR